MKKDTTTWNVRENIQAKALNRFYVFFQFLFLHSQQFFKSSTRILFFSDCTSSRAKFSGKSRSNVAVAWNCKSRKLLKHFHRSENNENKTQECIHTTYKHSPRVTKLHAALGLINHVSTISHADRFELSFECFLFTVLTLSNLTRADFCFLLYLQAFDSNRYDILFHFTEFWAQSDNDWPRDV